MTERRGLTLGEFAGQEDLALRVLVTPDGWVDRPVTGVHATELANPTRWLEPGFVMLTVGTRLVGAPESAQRDLVRELAGAGVTALGVGTGLGFDDVPTALLDEAEALRFPVFEVPVQIPFRELSRFVYESLASNDVYVLRRRLSMQNHLLEVLGSPSPEAALVQRAAVLLKAAVVLFDTRGRVIAAVGPAPAGEIWAAIDHYRARDLRVDVGGLDVEAVEIDVDELTTRWFAVAGTGRLAHDELRRPLLSVVEHLLQVIGRTRTSARAEDRIRRAELLDGLLAGIEPGFGTRVWDRLGSAGFDRDEPLRVITLTAPDVKLDDTDLGAGEAATLLRRLEGSAEMDALPLLLTVAGGRVVALVQATDDGLRRWLEQAGVDVAAGVGRTVNEPGEVPVSARDADLAGRHAASLHRPDAPITLVHHDDLGLADWLLVEIDAERAAAKATELLAPIADQPLVLEAIVGYLRHDFDVVRTAQAMHLHPNSLRYRLTRAEQLLGRSLRSPATIANLYLALRDQLG